MELKNLCPLLQVYDMPTSIAFYCGSLGFELKHSAPEYEPGKFHWCLLQRDDVELMLNTAYEYESERPVPPDAARVVAHEDVCLYFSCPDVDGAYAEFKMRGVAVSPPKVAPYDMKQLTFHDPDGYVLCFQWPAK